MADKQKTASGKAKAKGKDRIQSAKKPEATMAINIETIQITKVTMTDQKGQSSSHYVTGSNVSLPRSQQIITELIIEAAKREGKASAEQIKTVVKGGPNDDKTSAGSG